MSQTPWTRSSSFPSDRINPSHTKGVSAPKGKRKESHQAPELVSNKEIQVLQATAKALRASSGREKDPHGGCFCQARKHSLSAYTPICFACGVVLCCLNLSHHACPYCITPLVSDAQRTALLERLELQIAEAIKREIEKRDQVVEEARRAAGAFPTLKPSTPPPQAGASQPVNRTHKVLSLNSTTKKVVISSYTTLPPRPTSHDDPAEEVPIRVPRPPVDVVCFSSSPDPSQPWVNLSNTNLRYVPLPRTDSESTGPKAGNSRRRKGKKGAGEMADKVEVQSDVAGPSEI